MIKRIYFHERHPIHCPHGGAMWRFFVSYTKKKYQYITRAHCIFHTKFATEILYLKRQVFRTGLNDLMRHFAHYDEHGFPLCSWRVFFQFSNHRNTFEGIVFCVGVAVVCGEINQSCTYSPAGNLMMYDAMQWEHFPHYWSLVGVSTGQWWIPLTKDQ